MERENFIIVDSSANMYVSPEYLKQKESLFEDADYCVVQMEIPAETVRTAIELSRKHQVKVVLNPSPVSDVVKELLTGVDYLIQNEIEAGVLLGKPYESFAESDWTEFMKQYDIENMIITIGKRGCRYYDSERDSVLFPVKERAVVDTTGAGDTFLGAFVAALEGQCDIAKAICFANAAAGIAVAHYGAQQAMPAKCEVDEELQKCGA